MSQAKHLAERAKLLAEQLAAARAEIPSYQNVPAPSFATVVGLADIVRDLAEIVAARDD